MENSDMGRKQFTDKQISRGLQQLQDKLTQLSIFSVIIRPYFFDYVIIDAHPLVWVIVEMIHHVYGQTTRCWFDQANKQYKTISVCEMYEQITKSKKYKKHSLDWEKSFNKIGKEIKKTERKYKKRLSTFADKYYAHNEVRTSKQRHKEFETLKAGWPDIEALILSAKNITTDLIKFWDSRTAHFSEGDYQYFRDKFWHSINSEVLKPASHFYKNKI